MLGASDLVFCSANLMHAGLRAKLEAAQAGDFRGISLWPTDYQQARGEGLSDAQIRRLLADHGVEIAELDTLITWLPGSEPAPGLSARDRAAFGATADEFFAIADALGARSLNLAQAPGPKPAFETLVECFARICDRAAEHGLLCVLEFLPFSEVRDASTAQAIVEAAGRGNGGVMFDTWHHFRGGGGAAEIRALRGERIQGLQLNDAPAAPEPDLVQASMTSRLAPGEGAIPLAAWLRALDAIGCRAPLGVEVFSTALSALPPAELGRRLGAAARRVVTDARGAATPA
jgi:sugar phosphate isomerase/epimerase